MRPGLAGRLCRFLIGCHPRRWRERYGEEVLDVLDPDVSCGGGSARADPGPDWLRMWQDSYWHPATDEPLEIAAFSPHTGIMVTAFGGAIDGTDMVWDVTELSRPQRLSQFEGGQPLALSPDGRTVVTVAARDVADFQPVIVPGDRTVLGSPPGSHAWHTWPLP